MLIEHEGAVYRGPDSTRPCEFWDPQLRKWVPYAAPAPTPDGWGYPMTEGSARTLLGLYEPFTVVPDFGWPAGPHDVPCMSSYRGQDIPPREVRGASDPRFRRRNRGLGRTRRR